ncbi:N-acetylmuramoyl-L-alanine amidase [Streptomyces sp. NPDC050508]|uniref:N-acetylmuramoyl-L-alanine amidase n=1 Tax=Streptomyces sp. NPDC050508 TaxID=3155405 RepID=UPI0034336E6B
MRMRRWWRTGAVVAAAVCGTLVVQEANGASGDSAQAAGKSAPVRDQVRSAALTVGGDGGSASLARQDVEPFSMLGITWRKPSADLAGTVEVRTRAAGSGKWSGWLTLDSDSGAAEQSASRGGTEPAWVGLSDGVEARIKGKVASKLPQGLRLHMITSGGTSTSPGAATSTGSDIEAAAFIADADGTDGTETPTVSESPTSDPTDVTPTPESATPDPVATEPSPTDSESTSESPSESPSALASESTAPSESATTSPSPSTASQPPVTARSGWGADESLSPEEPTYIAGKIKAVVVHHTASTNDYTCAQAPSIINAIYTYDVTTLGWKDIGYNFLVDKCGTIYEGRKGGVGLPVVGAHAYGFNSLTTGISVLGTYTDAAPSTEAMTSVARLSAWKLGQYGVEPDSKVTLTTAVSGQNLAGRSWGPGEQMTFPAIHGHRDGYNTLCPGDAFYAALGTVRTLAAGLTIDDATGTSVVNTASYTNGPLTVT